MSDTFDSPVHNQNSAPNSPADGALVPSAPKSATRLPGVLPHGERRSRRRALISAPVRVRGVDLTEGGPDEITTTLDVSRGGLLFVASHSAFCRDMVVAVTFPYTNARGVTQAEQEGRIARCTQMADGRIAVAVIFGTGAGKDLINTAGQKFEETSPAAPAGIQRDAKKPLVLVVDLDVAVRDSIKAYLGAEGYQVIAVGTTDEAHVVLKMFTPSLLIAEIEGEGLPGYALCAYVKTTPRLQTVPVVLMTASAYPSDYSSAHSLGAVVCMAKPFRQERLGHIVRLLAPTDQAKAQTAPPRAPGLTRKPCSSPTASAAPGGSSVLGSVRKRLRPLL